MINNDSVMVTTWTGLLAKGSTRDLCCFMAAFPYSITAKQKHHGADTWHATWDVLKWSFNAMATGKHPEVDTFSFCHLPPAPNCNANKRNTIGR